MTEPKTIILAGREITVPALPLRLNMRAYPLCRKLTNDGYVDRYIAAAKTDSIVEVSSEEFADLAELAFLGAKAADPALTREAFDDLAITPPELLDAFFPVRLQTAGWVERTAPEGDDDTGEAQGADQPPK